jgi:glycerophosphoryl diester phosphodiesterase
LNRTTNGTGNIYDKTLAELKTLDAGSWFAPEYAAEQIPTLTEALAVLDGRGKLILDIKAVAYVPAIVQTLQDFGFPADDVWVWNRLGTGVPFLTLMPGAHGVNSIGANQDLEEEIVDSIALGYDGIVINFMVADEKAVRLAHSYGMTVMTAIAMSPWFVQLRDIGVDIIVATAPVLLAGVLPGPTPECTDGIDNDGDGNFDYPDDPSCFGPTDPTEEDDCSDGIDNDGNGDTDFPADPGCFAPYSQTENPQCSDGIDNNGDGDTDYPADLGCFAVYDQAELAYCADGKDNDGDGFTDFPDDPDCPTSWSNDEASECGDGLDNDGDGGIDFPDDVNCGGFDDPWEGAPPKVPALSTSARLLTAALLAAATLVFLRRPKPSSQVT